MTSRELLALAVRRAAARSPPCSSPLAPRRLVGSVAVAGAIAAAVAALALAAVALARAGRAVVGDVARRRRGGRAARRRRSASSGSRSVLVSPAYLAHARASLVAARARDRTVLRGAATRSGRSCSRCRSPGTSAPPGSLVEATTAASALLVGFSGKPRALEAGWKYLILTSLGLGVALLGIVVLAAGVPGGGSARSRGAALGHVRVGQRDRARRLPAAARRPRRQDRLGARPQLAPGRALRGAAAGLGAALRGAAARACCSSRGGPSRRSRPSIGETHGTGRAGRVRARLARGRGAVPLALAGLEAAARLLEPRAHGRDRARDRLRARRSRSRASRSTSSVTRSRRRSASTRRRRCSAHEPRAAGHAATGVGRTQPALGATMGISLGTLAGLPPSPLFASEVLIVAGGFQAGCDWAAAAAAVLLALGFLGLAHALIETTAGKARRRDARHRARPARRHRARRRRGRPAARADRAPRSGCPGSDLVDALAKGLA